MNQTPESPSIDRTQSSSAWKVQFGVLCAMLAMALVGMGLSQASVQGAWEYWLGVVVAYAVLGLWRSTRRARLDGRPVRQLIGRELAHWTTLLAFLGILMLLESKAMIDRESASDFSLLLLAFSCCLAGIHFDGLLLIMGLVLTIMAVAAATLEQYSNVLWIVLTVVTIAAAAIFYFKSRRSAVVDVSD